MTITTYRNFDLLSTHNGAGYKVIVVEAPEGRFAENVCSEIHVSLRQELEAS
jgi:hypothetical protein